MQTEFPFHLPKGLQINDQLHQDGKMRLLTAKDELIVQDYASKHPEIDIVFLIMAQAIAQFGQFSSISVAQIEQLLLPDFFYLQEFFSQIQPQNVNPSGELLAIL